MKVVYTLLLLYCSVLLSCNTALHNKKGVEMAMQQYDRLIQKMDTDSIALLYTPNGELGAMAQGRDSIKKFLLKYKSYKVLAQSSTSVSIVLQGDSALQKGNYKQTVIIPGNDTVNVKGEYTAKWAWMKSSGWHIQHMQTKSL